MANPIDLSRLTAAHQASRSSLEYARSMRREMIREYVGRNYSEDGSRYEIPLNLMAMYVQIVTPNLIDNNPRGMVSTFDSRAKPMVTVAEKHLNQEIERQYFAETMQEVVIDAMFGPGIAKVCLMNPAEAALGGYQEVAGKARVRRVSLDDFAFDPGARDFRECGWIASRYCVPLKPLKESKSLPRRLRKDLKASEFLTTNEQGDERAAMIGRGYRGPDTDFEEMIYLWEYYFPRHGRVLTFADADGIGPDITDETEPLYDQPWIGAACGPYHFLRLGVVPDNAMPKAPMQDLYPLSRDVNQLLRKLIRQAKRQKSNSLFKRQNSEDGDELRKANDGDILGMLDPTAVVAFESGGAFAPNQAMMEQLKVYFDFLAGNLSLLGGLSAQSRTATQDKMLNENAGRQVAAMQRATVAATTKIFKSLFWYSWHNPTETMQANYDLPGLEGMSVELEPVSPQQRQQVPFDQLDLKIDAYSMRSQSPESRAEELKQVVMEIIMPGMGLLQQAGIGFDLNAFLSKYGRLKNMTDLPEIIGVVEPPNPDGASSGFAGGAAAEGAGMPSSTTRTYERVSTPGRTEQGDSMNRINSLMGLDTGGNPSRNGKPMGLGA